MADFKEYSEKGATLMQQALKKYAEGDFESGDKDRELANKYFDMASMEINSEAGKISQLYGESRNFGIIYNVFEQNIDDICQDESKRHILKEAYDMIRGNRILSEQFRIYDMFEKAHDVENPREFVNEASPLIGRFDRKKVSLVNEKFIRFMRKNGLNEYVPIPEETENLYEAIEYLMLNRKTLDNVGEFVKAQGVIAEHVGRKTETSGSKKDGLETFKDALEDEEKRISEGLNDDERKMLDMFTDGKTDARRLFEDMKDSTMGKVRRMIESSEGDDMTSWKGIYESIRSKEYSSDVSENVMNYAEMAEVADTIGE